MADEKVSFVASFPAIQSAIKITGDGGGMRITLDIPESEMAEAVKLMLYRQIALRVTVEAEKALIPCLTVDNSKDGIQKRSKWKSEGSAPKE
jgi:hypothetical protein